MGKPTNKNNKKKKKPQNPTTSKPHDQQQPDQKQQKPLITLFHEAPQSLRTKIQARAQKIQESKKARPETYTPSPLQESYPFATPKILKSFLKFLAQKKSKSSFSSKTTVRDHLKNRFQIFKKEHLNQIPGVPKDSVEILHAALNSAGDSSFHSWVCCRCHHQLLDSDSLIAHVNEFHVPTSAFVTHIDIIADVNWADGFLDPRNWDPEAEEVLENVKELVGALLQRECLSARAKDVVLGYTVQFVGLSQLEKIVGFLNKLVDSLCNVATKAEKASLTIDYPDVDVVVEVEEWWKFVFRAENHLVVDLQLLSETLGHELVDVDAVVEWLYTFPPPARFKCVSVQEWGRARRTRREMADKILDSVILESSYMVHYCKMKSEHLDKCHAFGKFYQETLEMEEGCDVEVLLHAFRRNINQQVEYFAANVDAELARALREVFLMMDYVKRTNDNESSIRASLKRGILRARELMDVEVCLIDVKIMRHLAKLKQLKRKLAHACFVEYLPVLVPIVQTYLRETLEMSGVACEAPKEELGDENDPAPKEEEKECDCGEEEPVMQDVTSEPYLKGKGDHRLKSDAGVVEFNSEEPPESQEQVEKDAAETIFHPGEKGPGDSYCCETQTQAGKGTTETRDVGLPLNKDSMDARSSSATTEASNTAESPMGNQDPSQLASDSLKTKWTRWFIHNASTIEDFWAIYDNVHHPSKMPVGADFYCFKHGTTPMLEDPACENGGKWIISFSRGNADTWWKLTLSALIEEQFDNINDICGATVNVREKQEKISLWTKTGLCKAHHLRIGKQWKELIDYKDTISFVLYESWILRRWRNLSNILETFSV